MKKYSYICMEYDIWNMIYVIYIYGMVSDILCIYVWIMIYVIFLYGSILLILSICKKLYISYTIDHFGSCKSSYCFFIFCPVRELF